MSRDVKMPSLQFYPADWRKSPDVQALNYHDRGVWFEILCIMHESERRGVLLLNGQAMTDEALARVLGLDKQNLTTTLTTLLTYGVASREEKTGALMCRRMVRDESVRKIRAEAGKLGGNPVLLKQKSTTGVKVKATPSSSSSSSSSEEEYKTFARTSSSEEDAAPLDEESKAAVSARKTRLLDESHDEFYRGYWRHVAKKQSRKAWPGAIVKVTKAKKIQAADASRFLIDQMLSQRREMESRSDLDWLEKMHPASWLNGERWEDELPPVRFTGNQKPSTKADIWRNA